jgi:hypothetical protein
MKPERKCKKNIQSRVEHMYEDTGTSPGTDWYVTIQKIWICKVLRYQNRNCTYQRCEIA